MGFEPVSVDRAGLAHVAGLGIDRGDHPVLGDLAGDAPRPLIAVRIGFDVLACNSGVVVRRDLDLASGGDRGSDPADHRHQLRHRGC